MSHASLQPIHPHLLATTHAQKVLVIDDVEMNATLIASVISTLCEVQTATSGTESLSAEEEAALKALSQEGDESPRL